MSIEAIVLAVLGLIGSGVVGWLAARAEMRRAPHQNAVDDGNALLLYQKAAKESATRELELKSQLDECNKRLDDLEARLVGPFTGIIQFTVNPLRVLKADIAPGALEGREG